MGDLPAMPDSLCVGGPWRGVWRRGGALARASQAICIEIVASEVLDGISELSRRRLRCQSGGVRFGLRPRRRLRAD